MTSLGPFRAVVFDLDGTLVDSSTALLRAWTTWAVEHEVTAESLQGFHGAPTPDIVAATVPAARYDTALARIAELEGVTLDGVVATPGAREALTALAGRPVAVATSGSHPVATARLGAARLTTPEVLVTFDDVERGKPHPEPFLTAAARLGVEPGECLVVEDAAKGVTAAKAAGCGCLALLTTSPAAELRACGADLVVPDLAAVAWRVDGDQIVVEPLS